MAEFTMNDHRLDPYKNFKFKVKWDTKYVAGISKVSALTRSNRVVSHREGGDPHSMRKSPGQTDYEPITLERGITFDLAFQQWANAVWEYPNSGSLGQEVSLKDFRKNITIEMYNISGQKVMAYDVYRCWPSEYTAMPELDAMGNAVAIQSITLENEGWQRDMSVVEAPGASYVLPPDPA